MDKSRQEDILSSDENINIFLATMGFNALSAKVYDKYYGNTDKDLYEKVCKEHITIRTKEILSMWEHLSKSSKRLFVELNLTKFKTFLEKEIEETSDIDIGLENNE